MERVEALIKRLDALYQAKAGNEEMLLVTQMLTSELQSKILQQKVSGKVSVIMPATRASENSTVTIHSKAGDKPVPDAGDEKPVEPEVNGNPVQLTAEKEDLVEKERPAKKENPITDAPPVNVGRTERVEEKVDATPELDPEKKILPFTFNLNEIANLTTAAAEKTPIVEKRSEINEAMSKKELSLNERLKMNNSEIGNKLKEVPIKDLKKAVGVNERYAFIQELFRGDEIMYERSIKTINSFSVLPEAEYWIQRELKVKIGWNEDSDTVKQFDQLVKRRFASM